jgi:hypothetical protein
MPFKKIQFSISYKSIERGYKPEYVDARNTSKCARYVPSFTVDDESHSRSLKAKVERIVVKC